MTNENEKSAVFKKFEFYFFRDVDLDKPLSHILDPHTVKDLTTEEKLVAEKKLVEALKTKIDKRWLFGLEEINSKRTYEFLLKLYKQDNELMDKIDIASSLLRFNKNAPVMNFLIEVLNSDNTVYTKKQALDALYWLKGYTFDPKKEELFLTTLYNAMTDSEKEIRSFAHYIVSDHFEMSEFTPVNDIVEKTISEELPIEEYQIAVATLRKRIASKENFPFDREIVNKTIIDLPDNPPTVKSSDCRICWKIPDDIKVDITEDKSLTKFTSQLDTVVIISYYEDSVKRCPICGQLYVYRYHYEYFVNSQTEEEERLIRSDSAGAIKLVDDFLNEGYEFRSLTKCGLILKINR
ncbi:MAG: hypothetical protein ACTSSH_02995 [Candidatus Heimdallarchaeota archaeon]